MQGLEKLRRGVAWALDPVVWIFVLAGTFEVLTGDPSLHATLLYAVAAVLVVDSVRRRVGGRPAPQDSRPAAPPRSPRVTVLLLAAGVAFGVIVGTFRRYTLPVTVAIWVPGALAVVWAWRVPSRASSAPRLTGFGIAAWAGLFATVGIWELVALLFQPSLSVNSPGHPTLSTLLDPVLGHPLGRMVAIGAWLAAGWFLVER
ncbi:MAG TPA: hypothetical protein VFW71_06300 [Actinomycetota bacterium]|nr:hypothetical protein [Actinomycetota bacterium]